MLIKLLGLLDFASAIAVILSVFGISNPWLLVLASAYLIFKALAFMKDLVSMIDLIFGAIIFLSVFRDVYSPVLLVIGIVLMQKGIFSIFS